MHYAPEYMAERVVLSDTLSRVWASAISENDIHRNRINKIKELMANRAPMRNKGLSRLRPSKG
jgi:hypothetical protein